MGTAKKFKQFAINTLPDALLVLGTLISLSSSNLDKYVEYTKESMDLKKRYVGVESIPGKEFEDLSDRVLFRQRELLEFMADEANDVFSYITLRKKLVKMGYLSRKLNNNILEILNELHIIRNWTFHNAQSNLVAEKEAAYKAIPPELVGMVAIEPQLNPIIVVKYSAYTMEFLDSFIRHNMIRTAQFESILVEMKQDYQDMYDQIVDPRIVISKMAENLIEGCISQFPVKVMINWQVRGIHGKETNVQNISVAIQKGKYDGTKESFNKHTSG